jgi:gliding motility-associated-like protein
MQTLRIIVLLLCFPAHQYAYCQSQYWPYGDKAAINISSNGAVVSSSSNITTGEGCSSIQDETGEVLFYTNGANVYSGSGVLINTGGPLFEAAFNPSSSTQGSAILPLGDCKRFLILATPGVEGTTGSSSTVKGIGVAFVEIDENDVITINSSTSTRVLTEFTFCEKLAIYENQGEYWIVAKELLPGGNTYFKWNLTADILDNIKSVSDAMSFFNTSSQSQSVGRLYTNGWSLNANSRYYQAQGQMKFSLDGTKLGHVFPADRVVELFDFNPVTGMLTNSRTFYTGAVNLYGFEFSSSGNSFFVTEHYKGTSAKNRILRFRYNDQEILNSEVIFTASFYKNYAFTALQLAIDGHIYVNGTAFSHLVRIENANGVTPSLNTANFGAASGLGLPLVISGDFTCDDCGSSSELEVSFCEFDSVLLSSSVSSFADFEWSTGQKSSSIYTKTPGTFICVSTDNDCITLDAFVVQMNSPTQFDLGDDPVYCKVQSILLSGPIATSYKWSNGATTRNTTVSESSNYILEVVDTNGCISVDSIEIDFAEESFQALIRDTVLCDSIVDLTYTSSFTSTLWSDNSTASSFDVSDFGSYWIEVRDAANCVLRDTFQVSLGDIPNHDLDTIELCLGQRVKIELPSEYHALWYDGDTSLAKSVNSAGVYPLVLISEDGCEQPLQLIVNQRGFSSQVHIPSAFTPNRDNLNEVFPALSGDISVRDYSLQIFTRWGEKIFETFEVKNWDGSYNGGKCQQGVYLYIIRFTDCGGEVQTYYGGVTLLD